MTDKDLEDFRVELNKARGNRTFRAAFGSIVQRCYEQLQDATKAELDEFCNRIGADNYYAEAKKHLNVRAYDLERCRFK